MAKQERPGVTIARLKQIAGAIEGLDETTSYGTLAFKVKKKLVARMREDGDTLVIAMGFVNRDLLMKAEPKVFHLKEHYLDYPYVLIHLDQITPTSLNEYLIDACARVRRALTNRTAKRSW